MPCCRDSASIVTSASPRRVRGTTPSWTMKSGLRRPTAENADFLPFQILSCSSCLGRLRVGANPTQLVELDGYLRPFSFELHDQQRCRVGRVARLDRR